MSEVHAQPNEIVGIGSRLGGAVDTHADFLCMLRGGRHDSCDGQLVELAAAFAAKPDGLKPIKKIELS